MGGRRRGGKKAKTRRVFHTAAPLLWKKRRLKAGLEAGQKAAGKKARRPAAQRPQRRRAPRPQRAKSGRRGLCRPRFCHKMPAAGREMAGESGKKQKTIDTAPKFKIYF